MFGLQSRHRPEPASKPIPERESGAWTGLPALPRAGDVELTAPTQSFLRSLTGRREPYVALAPLGHDVRLEAPAGIASGIARAVRASTATRSPLELGPRPRPLQRLLRRAAAIVAPEAEAPPVTDVSRSASEEPDQEPAAPAEVLGLEPEPQAAEGPGTGSPGEAHPVAPAAADLVSAPERTERLAAAEMPTAGLARSPATPAEHPSAPMAPLGDVPVRVLRAADPPAEAERPLLVAPLDVPAAAATPPARGETADEAPPPAEPPALGEAQPSPPLRPKRIVRRLGLGPPLPSGAPPRAAEPPAPVVQRTAAPEGPAAEPETPAAAASQAPIEAAVSEVGEATEGAAEEPRPAMPLPAPVVQRSEAREEPHVEPDAPPAVPGPPAEPPPAEADVGPVARSSDPEPLGESATPPARPTLGARAALRPSIARSLEKGRAEEPALPETGPRPRARVEKGRADEPAPPGAGSSPGARAGEGPDLPEPSPSRAMIFRSALDVAPSAPSPQVERPDEERPLEAPLAGEAAPVAEAEPHAEQGRAHEAPLVGGFTARPLRAARAFGLQAARALGLHARTSAGGEGPGAPTPSAPGPELPAPVVARTAALEQPVSPFIESLEAPAPAPDAPSSPGREVRTPPTPPARAIATAHSSAPVARVAAAVTGARATVVSGPTDTDPAPARRTAPLVAARSITHLQRSSLDSPAPAVRSDEPATTALPPAIAPPRRLEPAPAAGALASLIHRAAVPFPQAGVVAPVLPSALGPVSPVLARQPAPIAEPIPPAPVTVAREPAEPEPSAAAAPPLQAQAEAPAPVQQAEAAEAAPAAAAGGQSPQSVEEMAARIYDRIRSRLRDELLVDRERAGLVTDVR